MQPHSQPLPENGVPSAQIEAELRELRSDDLHAHWVRVCRGPADVRRLAHAAYDLFREDNGLLSLRSEGMKRIESAVTDMCLSLFHPPAGAGATFTTGGSESNYSALHAIREWARLNRPEVREPEIVAPYSAHPTFSKGCHYFGLKLTRTPLAQDRRASVDALRQALGKDTVGLVASAPCWPFGLYDPIPAIGELAAEHGLWLHIDACVGGYLAPFAERLGVPLPPWDFRVPAVQSISADLHKWGYTPKPASSVLWRSDDHKRFHYVHPSDWPGGQYTTAGFAGSRPAGSIYAAYAVLRYLGWSGYLRITKQLLETKKSLISGIRAIEGLYALDNDLVPLAFGARDGIDLGVVKAQMSKLGWILLATANPPLINLPIDGATDETVVSAFLRDLALATARARSGAAADREELRY